MLEVLAAHNMSRTETHYGELFVGMLENIVNRYALEISLRIVPCLEGVKT